ncbi:MAG: hypothetical protein ABIN89_26145 [Chitinophagaceae bacterium]
MKRFFLTKTFFILTTMLGLSSCKDFIVGFGGLNSMNAYYYKASELFSKKGNPSNAGSYLKGEITVLTDGLLVINYDKCNEKETLFIIPVDKSSSTLQKESSIINYEEINKYKTRHVLKVRPPWVICKPQFSRVRSEGYFRERNPSETLLARTHTFIKISGYGN